MIAVVYCIPKTPKIQDGRPVEKPSLRAADGEIMSFLFFAFPPTHAHAQMRQTKMKNEYLVGQCVVPYHLLKYTSRNKFSESLCESAYTHTNPAP